MMGRNGAVAATWVRGGSDHLPGTHVEGVISGVVVSNSHTCADLTAGIADHGIQMPPIDPDLVDDRCDCDIAKITTCHVLPEPHVE